MSNDNYKALLSMGNNDYYTAEQAGPFNEVAPVGGGSPHIALAAFVAFTIDGAMQQGAVAEASPPPAQWLWGNLAAGGGGWAITLRPSGLNSQLQIVARCTCANGTVLEAAADVTGPGLTSPFERIIVAGLWYSGSTAGPGDALLALSLNGSLAAVTFNGVPGMGSYAPSASAARLGADPVVAADMNSDFVNFISCGYAPAPLIASSNNLLDIGAYAGSTFRAFYSGYGTASFVLQDYGYDWKHRYDARSLSSGITANRVKSSTGSYIQLTGFINDGFALPANIMPDLGNTSPNPIFAVDPYLAVPLNRSGLLPARSRLLGFKNIPYYQPPSFEFPGAA